MSEQTSIQAQYYQPSGNIDLLAGLKVALVGTIAAIGLGIAYGYWMYYVFALLTFWMPPIFGSVIGSIVGSTAKKAKIRAAWFVAVVGGLVGLLGFYSGWVFWLLAWSDHAYFAPFSHLPMWPAIQEVAREGIWYFDEFKIEGGWAWFVFGLEFLFIIGTSCFGAWLAIESSDNTFCDACGEWTKDDWTSHVLDARPLKDPEKFKSALDTDPAKELTAFTKTERKVPGVTAQLKVQACPNCQDFHVLDVVAEEVELIKPDDDEDEPTESTTDKTIVDNLLIDKSLYETLKQNYS